MLCAPAPTIAPPTVPGTLTAQTREVPAILCGQPPPCMPLDPQEGRSPSGKTQQCPSTARGGSGYDYQAGCRVGDKDVEPHLGWRGITAATLQRETLSICSVAAK
jgi:hypothetical protein